MHRFIIAIGLHTIEVKKSRSLSAGWRTRKADIIIQSKFEGLGRGVGEHWCESQGPKTQEPRTPVSEGRRQMTQLKKRKKKFSLHLFILSSPQGFR